MRESAAQFDPSILARLAMRSLEHVSVIATQVLLLSAAIFSVGCGAKTDRLPISGAVTLDGAPLEDGSIRFTSVNVEKLFASGAPVNHGEFQIPGEKGLPPGTYFLEISAADPNSPAGALTASELIPPEYNVDSQHKVEVTSDGENHFVFEIVTKSR